MNFIKLNSDISLQWIQLVRYRIFDILRKIRAQHIYRVVRPCVGESRRIGAPDTNDLRGNLDCRIHQLRVMVIKIIAKLDAIGICKTYRFVTDLIFIGIQPESQNTCLDLGFMEHPVVKEHIIIISRWYDNGYASSVRSRRWFSGFIDSLCEFVFALYHTISSAANF